MRTLRIIALAALLVVLASSGALAQRLIVTMQAGQTTGNGTAVDLSTQSRTVTNTAVFVEWGTGTGAGVITLEEAYDDAYSGTWGFLTTADWSAADETEVIHLAGVFNVIRARISTTVTGGTVTVRVIAQ